MPFGFFMKRMENNKLKSSGIKVIVGTFLGPFIQVILLFISAGRMNIPRAWIYLVVSLVSMFGGIVLVGMANPELLNHRGRWNKKKDTKKWDRSLLMVYGITGFYILPIVIGLDIRFQWSYLGMNFTIVGIVLFLVGSVVLNWAMMVNTHFETTVRIQNDRGHKVISSGPYKIVRHPGYLAGILYTLSIPLIIGSVFSFIPVGIYAILFIIRTSLEDRTLHKELDGYSEYTEQTRYRLFLGIL